MHSLPCVRGRLVFWRAADELYPFQGICLGGGGGCYTLLGGPYKDDMKSVIYKPLRLPPKNDRENLI